MVWPATTTAITTRTTPQMRFMSKGPSASGRRRPLAPLREALTASARPPRGRKERALHQLYHLCDARRRYWHYGVDDLTVERDCRRRRPGVHPAHHPRDVPHRPLPAARVDPLGREREQEVCAGPQAAGLEARPHHLLDGARPSGRLQHHELPGAQVRGDLLDRGGDAREVRRAGLAQRRHADVDGVDTSQGREVGSRREGAGPRPPPRLPLPPRRRCTTRRVELPVPVPRPRRNRASATRRGRTPPPAAALRPRPITPTRACRAAMRCRRSVIARSGTGTTPSGHRARPRDLPTLLLFKASGRTKPNGGERKKVKNCEFQRLRADRTAAVMCPSSGRDHSAWSAPPRGAADGPTELRARPERCSPHRPGCTRPGAVFGLRRPALDMGRAAR